MPFIAVLGLFLTAACTTDRVTTDFNKLNEVADQAHDSLIPRLAPTLARERQAQITAAARKKDFWFLSDACQAILRGADASEATSCSITRVSAEGTSVPQGQGMALYRRMNVIHTYVGALAVLTDPSVENDLMSAADALVDSLGELGAANVSDDLLAFVEKRLTSRKGTRTVVTTAISGLRYRKMRGIVLNNDDNVSSLVREIQVGIVNLKLEPAFASWSARLRAADARMRNTDPDNVGEYAGRPSCRSLPRLAARRRRCTSGSSGLRSTAANGRAYWLKQPRK